MALPWLYHTHNVLHPTMVLHTLPQLCISWLNFWGTQSKGQFQGAVNIPDLVQSLDSDIVDIVELMNLCVQQRWGTEVGQGCYEHNDGGGSARKVHVQAMRYICVLFSLLGAECMGSTSVHLLSGL